MAKTAKKKPGRPRLSTKGRGASKILGVRLGADLRKQLDRWRKAQSEKLSRSEAARRLMEAALYVAQDIRGGSKHGDMK
jgi:hypothetical protein